MQQGEDNPGECSIDLGGLSLDGDNKEGRWVNLFYNFKALAPRGDKLNFTPLIFCYGVLFAHLEGEEIHRLVGEWDRVVILFVARVKPQLFHVHQYIKAQ